MSVYAQEQHWQASRPEVGIHAGSTMRKAWSGPVRAPKRILSGHGGGGGVDAVRPRGFRRVETAQEAVNILDAEVDMGEWRMWVSRRWGSKGGTM